MEGDENEDKKEGKKGRVFVYSSRKVCDKVFRVYGKSHSSI